MTPRASVVIPVYNEADAIKACLDRIFAATSLVSEVLVVYDDVDDSTRLPLERYAEHEQRVIPLLNTIGPGPANAIRSGFENANSDIVVVTMADGSDDASQIDQLVRLVERGVVIAAASRYMKGGQQLGAPRLKAFMSKAAGLSLWRLASVGTHDATSSFKAYDRRFVTSVGIESPAGFAVALEMVAKARRRRLPVAEIATIWIERTTGTSHFRLWKWLPDYLRWYLHAFGRRIR